MPKLGFYGLILLSMTVCGPLKAQDVLSSITDTSDSVSVAASTADTAAVPNATNLNVEWWRYFESVANNLATANPRIQALQQHLDQLIPTLKPDAQGKAQELRNRVIGNLQALAKTPASTPMETSLAGSFRDTYTIEQWITLERQNREKQKELANEQASIDQLGKAVEVALNQYDKEMATYISTATTDAGKAILGIEIMAARSSLALAQQRLNRYRKTFSILQTNAETLSQQKNIALERLHATPDSLKALDETRQQQQLALSRTTTRLHRAQSLSLGALSESPEALANSRLQEQRVTAAAIDEMQVKLQLAITDGMITLTRLLTSPGSNTAELRQQIDDGSLLSEESSNLLNGWRAETLREQNRSQTQLLSQPLESLKVIHQARNNLAQETQLKLLELNESRLTLATLLEQSQLLLNQQEGGMKNLLTAAIKTLQEGWKTTTSFASDSLFKIGETPVTILGLLRVVVIVTLAWTVSSLFRRALAKIAASNDKEGSALYTVGRLAHYVILLVGMMIALSSIGLDFSNLALVAGALSVGIGFGLQSIVNNFVSGLILLFERSLKVGDFIELDSGVHGTIVDINVRSTLINTNDNVDIIVPNSELVGTKVTNWTLREATRRMRIPFGVAYGCDKEHVKAAVLEAAARVPVTLQTPEKYLPQVWLVGFGDSSLNFELVVWVSQAAVKRPSGITAAYLWEIETSLKQHGIEIPFPQRDLNIRSLFDKRGAEAEALLRGKL